MRYSLFRWLAPSAGITTIVFCTLANHPSINVHAQEVSFAYVQEDLASLTTLEQEGITVLQSGPLHEAFAEQFGMEPEKPLTVKQEPPQAIEELPPAYQPEGENVVWIPGYWGWDVDAQDYVWISGVWRNVPPDQSWVPGYWSRSSDGWVWVSGFWMDENAPEQVEYLPTPPPTLDQGPSVKATVENQIWIPDSGCMSTTTTLGKLATGPMAWMVGFGFPPDMFGLPRDTFTELAIGITN